MVSMCLMSFLATAFSMGTAEDLATMIRSLPSPLDLSIRFQDGRQAVSTFEVFVKKAAENSRAIIAIHLVGSFSLNSTFINFTTSAGEDIIFSWRTVPSGISQTFLFHIEAKSVTSIDEVFAFVIRTFGQPLFVYESGDFTQYDKDKLEAGAAILSGIAKSGTSLQKIALDGRYGARVNVSEGALLELIRTTKATHFFVDDTLPFNISDAFFQDIIIKNVDYIHLDGIEHNDITDESLTGLNATRIFFGNSPLITAAGVRAFLQPVLIGTLERRTLALILSFSDYSPKDLFKDCNVTQLSAPKDHLWLIESPLFAYKAEISCRSTRFSGDVWFNIVRVR